MISTPLAALNLDTEFRRSHFEYQAASKRRFQSEIPERPPVPKPGPPKGFQEVSIQFRPDLVHGFKLRLGTNDSFTASKRLTPETEISLRAQEQALRTLSTDWDGYGSPPIAAAIIDAMIKDLRSTLSSLKCPPPDIIPGGDGSLQAEWHLHKLRLTYNIGPNLERYTWVCERQSGEEHEYFDVAAREALSKWAPFLA